MSIIANFLGALTILFIACKLMDIINWPMWQVLMPVWFPLVVIALVAVVEIIMHIKDVKDFEQMSMFDDYDDELDEEENSRKDKKRHHNG